MSQAELRPNAVILGERNYEAAINLVIAKAQTSLLIFDQDFAYGDFASKQCYELIKQFLSTNEFCQLTIILQQADFFVNNCPRLFDLLKLFGHKMVVFETNNNTKIAKDCFVVADKLHYVRRFHIDQARFKYAFDDETECANLQMRFDELMQETADAVSPTKLGL